MKTSFEFNQQGSLMRVTAIIFHLCLSSMQFFETTSS